MIIKSHHVSRALATVAGALFSILASAQTSPSPSPPPQPMPDAKPAVAVAAVAKYTHFRVGNKSIKSIFIDGKFVWIGTSGGVVRYDTRDDSYKLFDVKSGLLSNGIFWVGRVNGQIAVGTYGGGLSLLDEAGGTWKSYNIPEGLGDAFIYGVLAASNGDLWIATWSGVNRVREGKLDDPSKWDLFTVKNTNGGLINDWVYGLDEGKNGDIWLATEGGMVRFSQDRWENWNHARGIGAPYEKVKSNIAFKSDPSQTSNHHAKQKKEMGLSDVDVAYNPNYVIALKVDRQGRVWAGTWGGGLASYDGERWTNYTTADGLPGNHIFMLHEDPKGRLWIGTHAGIVTWEDGKFSKPLRVEDGLFANNSFAMATTPEGNQWIGSFGGVAFMRPGK